MVLFWLRCLCCTIFLFFFFFFLKNTKKKKIIDESGSMADLPSPISLQYSIVIDSLMAGLFIWQRWWVGMWLRGVAKEGHLFICQKECLSIV